MPYYLVVEARLGLAFNNILLSLEHFYMALPKAKLKGCLITLLNTTNVCQQNIIWIFCETVKSNNKPHITSETGNYTFCFALFDPHGINLHFPVCYCSISMLKVMRWLRSLHCCIHILCLEENRCCSHLQEEKGEGSEELQTGEPHFGCWVGHGANNTGNHFEVYKGQEGD